jgi:hypothetical protein
MQPGVGYSVYNSGKGLTLDINKPWSTDWIHYSTSLVIELYRPHPFRIIKLTSETALAAGFFYNFYPDVGDTFTVLPGTVNDVPCSLGITSCASGTVFVYVQTYPTASISIIASTTVLVDDDTAAYILIGTVTAADKHQYVHGNIQCERFVLGQATASYHYSSDDLL